MIMIAPTDIQPQILAALHPDTEETTATLAFYQIRKALENPEIADAMRDFLAGRASTPPSDESPDDPPDDLFGAIEAEVQPEAEPSAAEVAEAFPPSVEPPAPPARSPHAPDPWELAKRRHLHFGKYGHKCADGPRTFFWVFENDPGWLEWALDETEQFDTATIRMVCHMLDR